MVEEDDNPPPPCVFSEHFTQGRSILTMHACIPHQLPWSLGILGPEYDGSFPVSACQSSPPPFMSSRSLIPSLKTGQSSPLVTPLNLIHAVPTCPYFTVLSSLRPPQDLTVPVLQSHSHNPFPRSGVITFALGICSACIPMQVAVRIPVAMDATPGKFLQILITFCFNILSQKVISDSNSSSST